MTTDEIEHKGEKFVPIKWILEKLEFDTDFINNYQDHFCFNKKGELCMNSHSPDDDIVLIGHNDDSLQYWLFQRLLEYHFDIADLISKGEAIDVNTLENPYK